MERFQELCPAPQADDGDILSLQLYKIFWQQLQTAKKNNKTE